MLISQATSILHEVEHSKPISAKTRAFQHRRMQNRFHRFILKTFREQQKKTGLTQKELAERIDSRPEQINRWLSIPGNLTINTICDLLLGMAVDLDDPSATSLADLAQATENKPVPQEVRGAASSIQIYIQIYASPPLSSVSEATINAAQTPIQGNTIPQLSTAQPLGLGLGWLDNLVQNFPSVVSNAITERRPNL